MKNRVHCWVVGSGSYLMKIGRHQRFGFDAYCEASISLAGGNYNCDYKLIYDSAVDVSGEIDCITPQAGYEEKYIIKYTSFDDHDVLLLDYSNDNRSIIYGVEL